MRYFPIVIMLFLTGMFGFAAVAAKEFTLIIATILLAVLTVMMLLQIIQDHKKEKGVMLKHRIPWGTIVILYVTGIMFILITATLVINVNNRIHSKSTTATISAIKASSDSDDEVCSAYVQYRVDGETYSAKYEESTSMCDRKAGEKVKIYYRKDDPTKVTTTRGIISTLLGEVLVTVALVLSIRKIIKERRI